LSERQLPGTAADALDVSRDYRKHKKTNSEVVQTNVYQRCEVVVVDAVRAGEQASTAKASLAARRAFVLLPSERLSIWEDDLIALVTC